MRVIELFAGIGGLSLGLERAGMETVAMVEIDPACRFWLSRNFPGVPLFDDVRRVTASTLAGLGRIDIIAGGFPCQPHSVAGKRRGQEDERHLWPEFARLVREIRPRWVLAENVPGIRTTAADEVLADLEAAGYSCWPLVVGADNVGAPHRRKRVWFVGRFRLADSEPGWRLKSRGRGWPYRSMESTTVEGGQYVAYRNDLREQQSEGSERHERRWACDSREESSWPSRPGEPQHEWEAPRMARRHEPRAETQSPADECNQGGNTVCESGVCRGGESRDAESRMGISTDGLSPRLARSGAAARRARLKALGNAVVPQVAEAIGRAIMSADK